MAEAVCIWVPGLKPSPALRRSRRATARDGRHAHLNRALSSVVTMVKYNILFAVTIAISLAVGKC